MIINQQNASPNDKSTIEFRYLLSRTKKLDQIRGQSAQNPQLVLLLNQFLVQLTHIDPAYKQEPAYIQAHLYCLIALQNYSSVIDTLLSIKDENPLLNIMVLADKSNLIMDLLQTLVTDYPSLRSDLNSLARVLIANDQFSEEAISLSIALHGGNKQDENTRVRCIIELGDFYQTKKDYHLAVNIYKKVTDFELNTLALIKKGYCYQQIAESEDDLSYYNIAINTYQKITDYEKNTYANITIGYCYMRLNKFWTALTYFEKYPNNEFALLAKERLEEKLLDEQKLISTFYQTQQSYHPFVPNQLFFQQEPYSLNLMIPFAQQFYNPVLYSPYVSSQNNLLAPVFFPMYPMINQPVFQNHVMHYQSPLDNTPRYQPTSPVSFPNHHLNLVLPPNQAQDYSQQPHPVDSQHHSFFRHHSVNSPSHSVNSPSHSVNSPRFGGSWT